MKKVITIATMGMLTLSLLISGCGAKENVTETQTEKMTVETATTETETETKVETETETEVETVELSRSVDDYSVSSLDTEAETYILETEAVETEYVEQTEQVYQEEVSYSSRDYEPSDLQYMGVISWGGWRWTYYSQRILPGEGLAIPGRYVDGDGFVCDENGYICLASGSLSKGTVVDTPFGKPGCVYDCGCAADVLDVYCDW